METAVKLNAPVINQVYEKAEDLFNAGKSLRPENRKNCNR